LPASPSEPRAFTSPCRQARLNTKPSLRLAGKPFVATSTHLCPAKSVARIFSSQRAQLAKPALDGGGVRRNVALHEQVI
jgi:hypothetical protein